MVSFVYRGVGHNILSGTHNSRFSRAVTKAKTVKDARIQYSQVARYIELLQENGAAELMFFFIIFERRLRKLHQERLPEPNPK